MNTSQTISKTTSATASSEAEPTQVDIAISGGGIVGGLAALLLGQALPTWRIAVLDGSAPGTQDPRTLALAHTTLQTLKQAGLWPDLSTQQAPTALQQAAQPIRHIHVSDRGGAGSALLNASDYALDALGQVAPAQVLLDTLRSAIEGLANVSWHSDTALSRFAYDVASAETIAPSGVQLQTEQGVWRSQLLIAADGGRSLVRETLGIRQRQDDYGQTALIANIELDRDHQGVAYERFTEQGPIALLPCGVRRMALVWCVETEQAKRYAELSDEAFLQALQQAFGFRAGRFVACDTRARYPLYLLLAERAVHHRTVLLGNACHTLHPIAGQGYNLGVRDVVDLVETLTTAAQAAKNEPRVSANEQGSAKELGFDHRTLLRYEQKRQADYQQISTLTDGLVRVFSNHYPPLRAGRNLGLLALRACKPLSRPLARAAMGYRSVAGE